MKQTISIMDADSSEPLCVVEICGKPCGRPQSDNHRHWDGTGCGETTWPWAHVFSATDKEYVTWA